MKNHYRLQIFLKSGCFRYRSAEYSCFDGNTVILDISEIIRIVCSIFNTLTVLGIPQEFQFGSRLYSN